MEKERKWGRTRSSYILVIQGQLSTESIDKVKQYLLEDWDEPETTQDPLNLWIAIKETHTSYSTGVNDSDKARDCLIFAYAILAIALPESLTPVE
jgi:hypothetical protein